MTTTTPQPFLHNGKLIHPQGARLFIKRDAAVDTSASGIILSVHGGEAPNSGVVVAHGDGFDGTRTWPMPPLGARVIYGKYAGSELGLDKDLKLTVLSAGDVICTITEAPTNATDAPADDAPTGDA